MNLIEASGLSSRDLPNTLLLLNRTMSLKGVAVTITLCARGEGGKELEFYSAIADRLEAIFRNTDLPPYPDLDDKIMETYDVINKERDPHKLGYAIRNATEEASILAIVTMVTTNEERKMSVLPIIRTVRRFVEVLS